MGNNPINLIDPTGMSARGTRLDGIAEEDDDQDDEVNAVSNGTTADEWERQKAAHHAQFNAWLGMMNSNGPSYYANRHVPGQGSGTMYDYFMMSGSEFKKKYGVRQGSGAKLVNGQLYRVVTTTTYKEYDGVIDITSVRDKTEYFSLQTNGGDSWANALTSPLAGGSITYLQNATDDILRGTHQLIKRFEKCTISKLRSKIIKRSKFSGSSNRHKQYFKQ